MFYPWPDATPLTIKLRYILPLHLNCGVFLAKMCAPVRDMVEKVKLSKVVVLLAKKGLWWRE